MTRLPFLFCFLTLSVVLNGCMTQKSSYQEQPYKIGTGSRIDILDGRERFYKGHRPRGWTLSGIGEDVIFSPNKPMRHIFHTQKEGQQGLHIQNFKQDYILARYTNTRLLVTPYLSWYWNVSEHSGTRHPIRLLIGFYGGTAQSPPLSQEQFVWNKDKLPPYDRLLAIGFDDLALKRATLYPMGNLKYYVQRGGIEQTNQWYFEAADLSIIYKMAWPQDNAGQAFITFVGFWADNQPGIGGITFSKITLSR